MNGHLYTVRDKMPSRCVVYGCSNYPDAKNQIALHPIPFYGDLRPEAVKRRKRWVDFVKQKRAKWEPSKQSRVCSKHFKADDFVRTLNLPGLTETTFPRLKKDEIGVTPYPTAHVKLVEPQEAISTRASRAIQRKVSKGMCLLYQGYLTNPLNNAYFSF